MRVSRLVQMTGLGLVTFVMIRSYFVDSMAFQFGGLAVGAAVFMIGKRLES